MVDVRDVGPRRPAAERPIADRLRLWSPGSGSRREPLEVALEFRGEGLEKGEPGADGAAEPLAQIPFRPDEASAVPELPEVLLEEVGLDDGGIQAEQGG